jgi:DNA-directed RNA polymerase specialized sigma24 family protein
VVARIVADDPSGMEELYRQCFARGVRAYFGRRLGWQDADDHTHDAFLLTLGAIKRGELRNPACLMGFVGTLVKRVVAAQIGENMQSRPYFDSWTRNTTDKIDSRMDPQELALRHERDERVGHRVGKLKGLDLAVVTRFYQLEEPAETIQDDLGLTDTQFRLRKSRALAKLRPRGYTKRSYQLSAISTQPNPRAES